MQKLTLFILLVASCSVFADNALTCTALKTKETCTANTSCKYTTSGNTCTNKCNALSPTDCALSANSSYCDVASSCDVSSTVCSTYTAKADCQGQTACTWADAVTASCSNKATIQTACSTKNQSDCSTDPKCSYTAPTFSSCAYNSGQCANKSSANCNTSYCNKTPETCKANSATPCASLTTFQLCNTVTACQFDGNGQCTDWCSIKSASDCQASSFCIYTPPSCADNTSGNICSQQNSQNLCTTGAAATFCSVQTTAAACNANATYCSAKNPSDCAADTNCTAVAASQASCSNTSAATCSALTTQPTCAANNGCTWKSSCGNKVATSCQTTDNQATCTGTGKFCTYAETGTCDVSSTSSSMIVASLIALIALI
ncbi:hypothetical protein ABPG74_019448 [Tetrahymena malaccensis]